MTPTSEIDRRTERRKERSIAREVTEALRRKPILVMQDTVRPHMLKEIPIVGNKRAAQF